MEHDMQIILVVFDKKSFQLSGKIVGEIDSYIDANYVKKQRSTEYLGRDRARRNRFEPEIDEACYEEMLMMHPDEEECILQSEAIPPLQEAKMSHKLMSLEEELDNLGMSFHDKLFELIAKAGIDNKDVWKLANLDRKHFSKIQCDANYHPKKKTVMALCIALKLNLDEAKDLMARADWAFSPSSKMDLIVQKAIIDKQYDIYQLNVTLFKYTNEILGV